MQILSQALFVMNLLYPSMTCPTYIKLHPSLVYLSAISSSRAFETSYSQNANRTITTIGWIKTLSLSFLQSVFFQLSLMPSHPFVSPPTHVTDSLECNSDKFSAKRPSGREEEEVGWWERGAGRGTCSSPRGRK